MTAAKLKKALDDISGKVHNLANDVVEEKLGRHSFAKDTSGKRERAFWKEYKQTLPRIFKMIKGRLV